MELMSTMTLRAPPPPDFRPAATPFSPNSTASTSGVSGTIVKTMSALRATSAALAQGLAVARAMLSGTLPRVLTNSFVAGVDEVPRHRRAHDAQADESDLHVQSSLVCQ